MYVLYICILIPDLTNYVTETLYSATDKCHDKKIMSLADYIHMKYGVCILLTQRQNLSTFDSMSLCVQSSHSIF